MYPSFVSHETPTLKKTKKRQENFIWTNTLGSTTKSWFYCILLKKIRYHEWIRFSKISVGKVAFFILRFTKNDSILAGKFGFFTPFRKLHLGEFYFPPLSLRPSKWKRLGHEL